MPNYIDCSLFADISSTGQILTYSDADALKESLRFFVYAKAGDILGFPEEGGLLDTALFRNFNSEHVQRLNFILYDTLTKNYTPTIEVKRIDITPDYTNKILNISVTYINPISNQLDTVSNYFKLNIPQQKTIEYIDIEMVGESLYLFCVPQKEAYPNERMIFNGEFGKFVFGPYKFVNFIGTGDPFFSQIIALLNG